MSDLDEVLGLAEATTPTLPKNEEMVELSKAVDSLVDIRSRIDRGEELLKELKAEERKISGETIPSLLDEFGVTEIKTTEGRKVSYKPFYSGKIVPGFQDAAYNWLEDNGHGGVIKGELSVPYRRQSKEEAEALREIIEDHGFSADTKLSVHHATLRALFREVIEDEGKTFPPELFDVFIGRKTNIK